MPHGGRNSGQVVATMYSGAIRGELAPLREIAELCLREVEERPDSPEAVVALRINGATEWFAGNFNAARAFLERARAAFDPQRRGRAAAGQTMTGQRLRRPVTVPREICSLGRMNDDRLPGPSV